MRGFFTLLILLVLLSPPAVFAQGAPWLVKDISAGSPGSNPTNLINVNGVLYFVARDNDHGFELWTSNGTADGTYMVKDINPDSGSSLSSLNTSMANLDGTLFFNPDPGSGKQLWKSDGVDTSTMLVADIQPTSMICVKNKATGKSTLFLSASDPAHGQELWVSDGTTSGTVLLKDIRPGVNGSNPTSLTDADGTLYFIADDGIHGQELWKSDGTLEGTLLVRDIHLAGKENTQDRHLTYAGYSRLFFVDTDTNGQSVLWCSNGTVTGTYMVDTGTKGTHVQNPLDMVGKNGILYFYASDDAHGSELWRSNGSTFPAGTYMVKDITPGLAGSYPSNPNLTFVKEELYFVAYSPTGIQLWKSDGSEVGTVKIKDIWADKLTDVNGKLYFTTTSDQTYGQELWISDGTTVGTKLVADLSPGTGSSDPKELKNVNGTLYFSANALGKGRELWATAVEGETGSLLVAMNPQLAIDLGAKWRRKGTTAWLDSGYTETKIPVGDYTIEFKILKSWMTPEKQTVTIVGSPTFYTEGTYQMILGANGWMNY